MSFLIKVLAYSPVNKHTKKIIHLVEQFSHKKVAVWGDFILDEFIYGNTRRISREAPVLILSYKNQEYKLGGAGNALLNMKALEAEPVPVGIVGQDDAGEKILQILHRHGIPTDNILRVENYRTPIKTRILAGEQTTQKQQILRIDKETRVPENREIEIKLQNLLKELRTQVCSLLISDYNYYTVKENVFKRILNLYKSRQIPIILDSRYRLLQFKGITISTPNEPEVENCLQTKLNDDKKVLNKAGRSLLRKTEGTAILITRGSKGMVLYEKRKPPFEIPIHGTQDIVDVTGAGDTVASILSLALASGFGFKEASLLSNFGANRAVMKKGPATLSLPELKETLRS